MRRCGWAFDLGTVSAEDLALTVKRMSAERRGEWVRDDHPEEMAESLVQAVTTAKAGIEATGKKAAHVFIAGHFRTEEERSPEDSPNCGDQMSITVIVTTTKLRA